MNLVFAGAPLTNAYRNLTNVVLRVAARAGGGGPSVLVNAHFDSVFGTRGAAAGRAGQAAPARLHLRSSIRGARSTLPATFRSRRRTRLCIRCTCRKFWARLYESCAGTHKHAVYIQAMSLVLRSLRSCRRAARDGTQTPGRHAGASDCAACVGVAMEAARAVVTDAAAALPGPLVFLFNGGEETVLQASHGALPIGLGPYPMQASHGAPSSALRLRARAPPARLRPLSKQD